MFITITMMGLLLIILLVGRKRLSNKFKREVRILFAQTSIVSKKKFQLWQLENLPEPVQRYFKYVLKEGQPYINFIRLKHDGKFRPSLNKPWIDIAGEEYFTTQKPGFIWKGTTYLFIARDMFLRNKGCLAVSLLSFFKIIDAKGEQYNHGELLRWLSESVWFPTNFLPSDTLFWETIDTNTAKLNFTYHQMILYFLVSFNTKGEIIQMETKRFMDKKRLETWIIKTSNYKEINNLIVPTTAEAIWRLADGDHSYAKFRMTVLEYNIPEVY